MQGPVRLLSVALEHGTSIGASLAQAGVTTAWWAKLSERATAIGTGIGPRFAAGGGVCPARWAAEIGEV
eukprot:scaffold17685_cov63-Phaeocystis_antarctica.AAC.13